MKLIIENKLIIFVPWGIYIIRSQEKNLNQNRDSILGPPSQEGDLNMSWHENQDSGRAPG